MVEKLSYFPVNWVDGMKINKNHFIAIQNNVNDVVRDSNGSQLTGVNYGLLPHQDTQKSVKISLSIDNHKLLRVRVEECHALTPNGTRIEISPQNTHLLNLEMPYPESTYNITPGNEVVLLAKISVNPFSPTPFGEIDPEETPPRYPYILPSYKLDLISENEAEGIGNSGYQLTIGKIIVSASETRLIENYIPPCTVVNSHQVLIDLFTEIDQFFGQLEVYSVQISQKINRKNQSNDLAQMMLHLSDKVTTYLGYTINQFRWFGLHSPPAFMLDKVIALGRVVKNFVDAKSGAGKEELLNYFAEWCGLSQSEFEVMFTDLVNVGYNHEQIDKTLTQTKAFMKTMNDLFSALNRLDYIGKRKDAGIFVKERTENEGISKGKRNRSFLAD